MQDHPHESSVLLRLPQVQEIVPYSRSAIYAMISKGEFPKPIKLGPRVSAWVRSEVVQWAAESRISATRDNAP